MSKEKALEDLVEYYHDNMSEALTILMYLRDEEGKFNHNLPEIAQKAIDEFVDSFKFKYID